MRLPCSAARPGCETLLLCAWLGFVGAIIVQCAAAAEADPPVYVRQSNWQETMFASRVAQMESDKESAAAIYASAVMRGQDAPQHLRVPVFGWRDLYLIVSDEGDYSHDVANWAEARLVDGGGQETFLDTLEPASATQAWGTFKRDNKSTVGGAMKIATRLFSRGLGTHGASVIHYKLDRDYASFEVWVGVDASRRRGEGAVRFVVSNSNPAGRTPLARLWPLLARDFNDPLALRQMQWERQDGIWEGEFAHRAELARRYAERTPAILAARAVALAREATNAASQAAVREVYYRGKAATEAAAELKQFDFTALRLAIDDLTQTFGAAYPNGKEYLRRLGVLEGALSAWPGEEHGVIAGGGVAPGAVDELITGVEQLEVLRREALLANPLLDFDRVLLVRRETRVAARKAAGTSLGAGASNWSTADALPRSGEFKDELVILSNLRAEPVSETVYRPANRETLIDPVLHFEADRVLFAMNGAKEKNWRLWEVGLNGRALRQLTPDHGADTGHFDGCYLPDDRIVFASTASYQGLPCVFGSEAMTCLYLLDPRTQQVRQLTFEQDSDWCPTVLHNGRVLYLRWEYADQSHANSRILFHMNPDGTDQREFRGSGSWFPGSFFYAKPVPGDPHMVAGIASGHHGTARSGRFLLLDPSRGRRDGEGIVQEIPGRGKPVEPIVRDRLVDGVWPQFLMPAPLSPKYHLVSAKLAPDSLWGLYLVDVFDNVTLIKEIEGAALLWPAPVQKRERPPVIPDRINPDSSEATVFVADVYAGPGLRGVPRGAVKKLRVVEYYFARRGMGGLYGTLGADGPWDIKRILGTVPVEADGSAHFRMPANTPVFVQPLDRDGQALQLERSWFVGMPGERVSCIGCHESQDDAALSRNTAAMRRPPSQIAEWFGPARGFSFGREVQPVLDRHCVACHDDSPGAAGPHLKGDEKLSDWSTQLSGHWGGGGKFTRAYWELQRFVRRPGIEGDRRMFTPMEYHFNTTELGQLLRKGHHGVTLDPEGHERLASWVDLNAPFYGTWGEIPQLAEGYGAKHGEALAKAHPRAMELRRLYVPAGPFPDYEHIPAAPRYETTPVVRARNPIPEIGDPGCDGWPLDAASAHQKQQAASVRGAITRTIDLGNGVQMELVRVPGGSFLMGSTNGHADEMPRVAVTVKPFWMARFETSNRHYKQFDATHESRTEDRNGYQFGAAGYDQDQPDQPAVRVSWEEAMAFCHWLSARTGVAVSLPTEAQWEWACRAGAATAFSFGDLESDYAAFANLGDQTLREFAADTSLDHYSAARPMQNPNRYDDWIPRDDRFNDGGFVTVAIGQYKPNRWGLHDLHGNAWEWTLSAYRPYPYRDDDGRNAIDAAGDTERVARGGSWRDRPFRSTASFRLPMRQHQRVFNVGFRVVLNDEGLPAAQTASVSK